MLLEVASRVKPNLELKFANIQAMREEIARIVPIYAGIEKLALHGDSVQYGGWRLLEGGAFETPDARGRFSTLRLEETVVPDGMFRLSTRRGKQFNSMVHASKDALNGATRDAVLISSSDAVKLGLHEGQVVTVRLSSGAYTGRVFVARVKPGNLQVHWPEGNGLLDAHKRSLESHVPDCNALVTLEVTD